MRLFLELGAQLAKDPNHRHAADIQHWVAKVQEKYNFFSSQMDVLQNRLNSASGRAKVRPLELLISYL